MCRTEATRPVSYTCRGSGSGSSMHSFTMVRAMGHRTQHRGKGTISDTCWRLGSGSSMRSFPMVWVVGQKAQDRGRRMPGCAAAQEQENTGISSTTTHRLEHAGSNRKHVPGVWDEQTV